MKPTNHCILKARINQRALSRVSTDRRVLFLAVHRNHDLYNKRRYVCLFVCLYLCSVWPAKRLGQSRPNLTHALMSTQGVFLSRSMSFMYACGSDRITKHPERCTKAHLANAAQTTSGGRGSRHLGNAYETPSGQRIITARVTRRGAAGAEQQAPKARVELRPEDG